MPSFTHLFRNPYAQRNAYPPTDPAPPAPRSPPSEVLLNEWMKRHQPKPSYIFHCSIDGVPGGKKISNWNWLKRSLRNCVSRHMLTLKDSWTNGSKTGKACWLLACVRQPKINKSDRGTPYIHWGTSYPSQYLPILYSSITHPGPSPASILPDSWMQNEHVEALICISSWVQWLKKH